WKAAERENCTALKFNRMAITELRWRLRWQRSVQKVPQRFATRSARAFPIRHFTMTWLVLPKREGKFKSERRRANSVTVLSRESSQWCFFLKELSERYGWC